MTQSVIRNYHTMFRHIKPEVIEAIKTTIQDGLWRADAADGFVLLRELAARLSSIYNILVPSVSPGEHECYWPAICKIELPRISIVSFLHEFRHHMQQQAIQHYDDLEVDARAWSVSCFRCALPKSFDKAWKNSRIWFLPPHPEITTAIEAVIR